MVFNVDSDKIIRKTQENKLVEVVLKNGLSVTVKYHKLQLKKGLNLDKVTVDL